MDKQNVLYVCMTEKDFIYMKYLGKFIEAQITEGWEEEER